MVASIVYAVPEEFGSAIWISSLNPGLSRSAQHFGGAALLGEELRVVAESESARVDSDGPVLRTASPTHRPFLELAQLRRLVLEGQPLLRGLEMGVASATPPDVALRVRGLGLDLSVVLPGALAGHAHLDAGGALEGGHHRPAPLLLGRAIENEISLRPGDPGHETRGEPSKEHHEGTEG